MATRLIDRVGALNGSWLQAGDTVEVTIGGVGVLRNTVIDEWAGDATSTLELTTARRPTTKAIT